MVVPLNPLIIAHIRESDGAPQSISEHLTRVGTLTRENAKKIGLEDIGELLGLLHDAGKCSEQFQKYIQSAENLIDQDSDDYIDAAKFKGKIDHSTAGAQWIWRAIPKIGKYNDITCAQILALVLASHHSGLIDCLAPDGKNVFAGRMDKVDAKTHLEEVRKKLPHKIVERVTKLLEETQIYTPLKKLLRDLNDREQKYEMTLDKRSEERAKGRIRFKTGLYLRILFSCLIDADRTDTADFEKKSIARIRQKGGYISWQTLSDRLEAHLTGLDKLDPINIQRQKISENCKTAAIRVKGIYTLTVPTGGGKTLAALRFALNHAMFHEDIERIFYVIPYTTIIEQNADVVRGILELSGEEGRVVLECHSNLSAERETWRGKILSERWDAPIIFTTNVQFLETLFSGGTRSARRMHQLARSVIIFDEIQTLPIRTVHMFCNALNFLAEQCGSTAILCTATQPLLGDVDKGYGSLNIAKDNEISSRDLINVFNQFQRVEIIDKRHNQGFSCEEITKEALKEQELSGSVLVVANTVKIARKLYQYVKERFEYSFHLSANMCPAHRKKILDEVRQRLKDSKPVICVSTQVIEAGVDIDFGAGIRLLAGLDSAAQTAGRVNRNAKRPVGRVLLLNSSEENLSRLPDIRMGKDAAQRVLDELKEHSELFELSIQDPRVIERYFRYYFFEKKKEMHYMVDNIRTDNLLNILSNNSKALGEYQRINGDTESLRGWLRQSFESASAEFRAIDAPTRGVIVPYGKGKDSGEDIISKLCGAYKPEKDAALLRRAQQYAINLYPNEWKELVSYSVLKEVQEGTDIWYLLPGYYSEEFGLSDEQVEKMKAVIS